MARRAPSNPPALPGLTPVELIGSGGFADVFLYQQELPRRRVAVKVLIPDAIDETARRRFVAEADAMAQFSSHPGILSIHSAGVAGDGRPYLVMEYCSRPNLAQRLRTDRIAMAEALQIGIRLASAVETAHRGGILHRDIKPANVLMTDYGWPALSDFGIASSVESDQFHGVSVMWAAPELFASTPRSDQRSDIYSLAATLYALLAGRSPFEVPGDNSTPALISRIERSPVPPTGRPDSTQLLEQVLARAMNKRPEARPRTALEFAHALQAVQRSMGFELTPVDVRSDDAAPAMPTTIDDQQTRVRGVVSIGETSLGSATPSVETSLRTAGTAMVDEKRSPLGLVLGLIALVAVVGVVAGVLVFGQRPADPQGPEASQAPPTSVVGPEAPAAVTELRCTRTGDTLSCSWQGEGDDLTYLWRLTERPDDSTATDDPTLEVDLPDGVAPCVEVTAVRAGRSGPAASKCAA